mgnify:FL=1
MKINADFSQVAIVIPMDDDWVRSPESGVERLMLDRIGDEVARATSIVRYASGSSFPEHSHAKGEEFLVLDGVFSDESGDYPAGTYVRNPPGSSHAPFSKAGCRILVKLRQFHPRDLAHVVVNASDPTLWEDAGVAVARLPLHGYEAESEEMRRIDAGTNWPIGDAGGTEILVVGGSIQFDGAVVGTEGWLRLPPGREATLTALDTSVLWIKTGHLTGL